MAPQPFATPRVRTPQIVVSLPSLSEAFDEHLAAELGFMDENADAKVTGPGLLPAPQMMEQRGMSWNPAHDLSSSPQAQGTPPGPPTQERRQPRPMMFYELPLEDHYRVQNAAIQAQIMSDRAYVDSAEMRLNDARAMADYAAVLVRQAHDLHFHAALDLDQGRIALEGHAALIEGLGDIAVAMRSWSEMSIAEKVQWIGLKTARTLSYSPCTCTDPSCTLPQEVKHFLQKHDLL